MAERYDAVVIGSGPGGYVCAIRLGQLGKKVACVERGDLGGVCLNWGCIPSKAVIHAAELRQEMSHANEFGIGPGGEVPVDVDKLRTWKEGIIAKLHGGIRGLFKGAGVTLIKGSARLSGPNSVHVELNEGGTQDLEAEAIVVATGGSPIELPFLPRSHPRVWTSEELLELKEIPKRLAIVGGGVIGLEFGCSMAKLGSQVTIVELLPHLMGGFDPEMLRPVTKKLKKLGATIHTEAKAKGLEDTKDGVKLIVEGKDGKDIAIEADRVLVSIGFKPNSRGIGLEDAGVQTTERGFVPVDPQCRTNVPSIFAIGDLTGAPFLAHRASKHGVVAAEAIAGKPTVCDFQAMPAGTFCDPEVGTVGLTEQEAIDAGNDVQIGRFPFAALGRSLAQNAPEGMVKVIGDKQSGLLLGVQITGPRANDMIAEAALAIEMGAQVEDLALTVHTHPTFSEGLMEAAEDFLGHAIHVTRRKR
ncbi:MAG TPA: dihydrolipoyl dehydrogenase [Planctomycetes bacterium]|nr:dihydrolipoyl dehydrogenase [Planctomycetota bacterium]